MNLSAGGPDFVVATAPPVLRMEERHPASFGLDSMTSLEVLELMNQEDAVSLADVFIGLDTGPEVLMGSTRFKAGTAEKLVLNGFSTTLMVQLGRTWSNLMVLLVASNAKLRDRTVRILAEATGSSYKDSVAALSASCGDLKVALVSSLAGVPLKEARVAVHSAHDNVGRALETLRGTR